MRIGWYAVSGVFLCVIGFFGMTLALYGCMIKRFEKSL